MTPAKNNAATESGFAEPVQVSLPRSFGVATYPAGATFGPRALHDYEFVWLLEGESHYQRNDEVFDVWPGSILLCRPGVTDYFRWNEHRRTRHAYFHFEIAQLPTHWPLQDSWPLLRLNEGGGDAGDDILRPLFRYLLTWLGRGDDSLCRSTVANLLTAFVLGQVSMRDVPPEALSDPVAHALKFIRDRLEVDAAAPLSLIDVAGAACVSSEHLCRLFQQELEQSPMKTVRLARLDRVAVLLARSNYSIAQIAHLCGFASPFHLSRQFKAAFGQSPTALRHAIQKGATPPTPRLLRYFGSGE